MGTQNAVYPGAGILLAVKVMKCWHSVKHRWPVKTTPDEQSPKKVKRCTLSKQPCAQWTNLQRQEKLMVAWGWEEPHGVTANGTGLLLGTMKCSEISGYIHQHCEYTRTQWAACFETGHSVVCEKHLEKNQWMLSKENQKRKKWK